MLRRHWGIHHESTAVVGWTFGLDGQHVPSEDGLLLWAGASNIGRPLKRFKDGLQESVGLFSIATVGWETLATDCSARKRPSTRVLHALKKSSCSISNRSDRPARKGELTQVLQSHALSVVASVRWLWAAFSPSASLTFSLLTMDFTNVLIWLLMITRGIRP